MRRLRALTQVVTLNNELGRLTRRTVRQRVLLFSTQFTETSTCLAYIRCTRNFLWTSILSRRHGPPYIWLFTVSVPVRCRTNVPLTISNLHGSIGRACNCPDYRIKSRIIARYLCNRFHNPQSARRSEGFPNEKLLTRCVKLLHPRYEVRHAPMKTVFYVVEWNVCFPLSMLFEIERVKLINQSTLHLSVAFHL